MHAHANRSRRCFRSFCQFAAILGLVGGAGGAMAADALVPQPVAMLTREQVATDAATLRTIVGQLREQEAAMYALRRTVRADERGHFTGDETDQIQRQLYHYLVCREALWDMVNR